MVPIHVSVWIMMINYISHLQVQLGKSNIMSGTKKPSNKNSKEIEIPLDGPDEILIQTVPEPIICDPEYFECTEGYSIFDDQDEES